MMTLSDVSLLTQMSWERVKAIVKTHLEKDFTHIRLKELAYLAIDEIYVGKRQRFYTLVIDLESGRIVWIGKGRGAACLQGFWRKLRASHARIQAVATDMSAAYWSAVLHNLPQAALVFDRFHIAKLANEKIDELRRALVREADLLQKPVIKGVRYLLLSRKAHLQPAQLPALEEALKFNEPLSKAYYLKEELAQLWEQPSYHWMKFFLQDWCRRALESGIVQMISLAKTLHAHARGILNYWRHPITTAKMEGTNNKIKTLTRKAYGYRDESFFMLKLFSLHNARYKLIG